MTFGFLSYNIVRGCSLLKGLISVAGISLRSIKDIISNMRGPYDYRKTDKVLTEAHEQTQALLKSLKNSSLNK